MNLAILQPLSEGEARGDGDRSPAIPNLDIRNPGFDAALFAHQAGHRRGRNRIGRRPVGVVGKPLVEQGREPHLLLPFLAARHGYSEVSGGAAAPGSPAS